MVCTILFGHLLPANVQAQNARKIEKKADASFKMKDYYTAAKLYASLLYDSASLDEVAPLYPYQSSNQKAFPKPNHRSSLMYCTSWRNLTGWVIIIKKL